MMLSGRNAVSREAYYEGVRGPVVGWLLCLKRLSTFTLSHISTFKWIDLEVKVSVCVHSSD